MNDLKFSQAAVDLIGQFEGFKSKPYLDSVKIPTIGYGTTFYENGTKVTMNDAPITEARAKEILLHYLNDHILPDFKQHITVELEQHQIDALCCLVYNIGDGGFDKSSVLKDIDNHIMNGVLEEHWKAWDKAGGKVLQGLLNRRIKEYHYFQTGVIS
jgi:lysozyme